MKNLENVLMGLTAAVVCLPLFVLVFMVFLIYMEENLVILAIMALAGGTSLIVWFFYVLMKELIKK